MGSVETRWIHWDTVTEYHVVAVRHRVPLNPRIPLGIQLGKVLLSPCLAEAVERARTTGKNAIPPDSSKQTRTTASRLLERRMLNTNQVQFESTFMFSLG